MTIPSCVSLSAVQCTTIQLYVCGIVGAIKSFNNLYVGNLVTWACLIFITLKVTIDKNWAE